MFRYKFLLPLALLSLALWFLGTYQPFGLAFPPLGPLLSPFSGFWQQAEGKRPISDLELSVEGMQGSVTIAFDDRMVPHIYAESLEDAFWAQGYVSAAFRLWQMDITARSTAGRLSEILGERLLRRDINQRRLGFSRSAKELVELYKSIPEEYGYLVAFTSGVNAFISSLDPKDYPIEYKLLHYEPEQWSPWHSILIFKSMAQTLCLRSEDVEMSNMREFFGEEHFQFLYPELNPQQSPVIPKEVDWAFEPYILPVEDYLKQELSGLTYNHDLIPLPPDFVGSNNWAVAGARTASGNPLLANDPHLNLTLPSIWYEMHIHTPEYQVYGVSIPGLPGLVIGFNADIAWGVTNVSQDVLDWYRMQWTNTARTEYELDGKKEQVSIVIDTIEVRGRSKPVLDSCKMTAWGPVVYTDPNDTRKDLAMHWLANESFPGQDFYELGAFIRLGQARNHADFEKALVGFGYPAQNFVFAAKDGDIALQVNGKFPFKREQQGRFVQDGSRSENQWPAIIPMDRVPKVKNPARGFVSSANQRSTDTTYPYYYNGYFNDYRGRYINDRLEEAQGWEPDDMMALQNDDRSLFPMELLPVLLERLQRENLSDTAAQILQELESWDYRFEGDYSAPVLFENWYRGVFRLTFDEIIALADSMRVAYPERWRLIEMLETNPDHFIFDHQSTTEIEDADAIITRAFREMVKKNGRAYANASLNWADYIQLRIRHLGQIDAFSSAYLKSDGYREAPNAISSSNGPSWRMVVELSDPVQAWGVFPGGQSGNPGSKYYDGSLKTWLNGEYHSLQPHKSASAFEAEATWSLYKK